MAIYALTLAQMTLTKHNIKYNYKEHKKTRKRNDMTDCDKWIMLM